MDPNERARKLVALATNVSASSEEARTAAMAACRLIVKHNLLDSPGEGPRDGAARRRPSRGPAPPSDAGSGRRAGPDDDAVNYRADRRGTCAFCGRAFGPEDEVIADVSGTVDHWHCAKRRAAGQQPAVQGPRNRGR
jgi:hypothetical protein